MPGMPAEQFDRVLPRDRMGAAAIHCPVRYDVWRQYGLRGPQARLGLLLERNDGLHRVSAARIALHLVELAEADAVSRDQRPPLPWRVRTSPVPTDQFASLVGDWIQVDTDLGELVRLILPLTSWSDVAARLATTEVSVLTGWLNPRGDRPGEVQATWLAQLLVRLWGRDPDLNSERAAAARELNNLVVSPPRLPAPGVTAPAEAVYDTSNWISSVSLDRSVTVA
jgi:hypothetical protein